MSEAIVQLKNVSLNYDHRSILIDANFKLVQQEFVYLIGPTGVGKSSILKLLYRDVIAQSGEVVVNGYQLNSLKSKKIPELRRSMGIVFQDFQFSETGCVSHACMELWTFMWIACLKAYSKCTF